MAALADVQDGVVTLEQLLALGMSREAVRWRVRAGRLFVMYRGVYSVGRRSVDWRGRYRAAVLACGAGAALSGRAAGHLHGIAAPGSGPMDVTVPWKRSRRDGIRLHQVALPADERGEVDGLAVTSVGRTIFDMAPRLTLDRLKRVVNQAERMGPQAGAPVAVLLCRYPRKAGAPMLRRILAEGDLGRDITRSELEALFQDFLRGRRHRMPELNAPIQLLDGTWIVVDCLWRRERVIVELDSRAFHADAEAFEADRRRDTALAAAGWPTVLRVTWRRLTHDANGLDADLGAVLRRSGAAA